MVRRVVSLVCEESCDFRSGMEVNNGVIRGFNIFKGHNIHFLSLRKSFDVYWTWF